jgi:hypothetical protein
MQPFYATASSRARYQVDARQFKCVQQGPLFVQPRHCHTLRATELYKKATENRRSFRNQFNSCQELLPHTLYEAALFMLEKPATHQDCLEFMNALRARFIGWHGLLLAAHCAPTLFPEALRVFALQTPWAEHGRTHILSVRRATTGAWEQYPMIATEGSIPAGFCLMVVTHGKN